MIEYTGLRPGERLHETLFHVDERYSCTVYPDILQAEPRAVVPERVLAGTGGTCARSPTMILRVLRRPCARRFPSSYLSRIARLNQ